MTPTSLSRFLAATFAVVSTAALVFADDPTRPVEPFDVAQTPAGQAVAFTTTGDQSQLFRRSFLEIADADAKNAVAPEIAVDLDPSEKFQTLDGFGAAITGSTAFNLFKMTPEDRRALLVETFDPKIGLGFNFVRVSIGCSDFSLSEFSLCEKPGIENFALSPEDREYVIPALKAENPAFTEAVGRMARLLREDEVYLDDLAHRFVEENSSEGGTLPAAAFAKLPRPVARRVVRCMAGPIPLSQIDRVLELTGRGGTADLTGVRVQVSEGRIAFGAAEAPGLRARVVCPGEEILLPEAGLRLRCEKMSACPDDVHKSFNTFYFSCENIDGSITVGPRRPGDRYRPLGRGCTKTLKALFLENGVPRWQRGVVPVLRDGAGILGVYGMPPAERAAARREDTDILKIDFIRATPEGEG